MNTGTMTKPAETKPAEKKALTVRQWLSQDSMKAQFAVTLPKHLSAERFVRSALTALTRNPDLEKCTQQSLFLALLQLAQYGLEPDGRRAHLIPFRKGRGDSQAYEVQLVIDYKGLAELVHRSGVVSTLHADLICEHDDFEYDCGVVTRHRINFRNPRGAAYAAYAICQFRDGAKQAAVMTLDEVNGIRDRSQGYQAFKKGYTKQSPWESDYGEMAKKTVFRRLSKWLPLSPEIRDAIEQEDENVIETTAVPSPALLSGPLPSKSERLAASLGDVPAPEAHDDVPDQRAEDRGSEDRGQRSEDAGAAKIPEELASKLFDAMTIGDCNKVEEQWMIDGLEMDEAKARFGAIMARKEEIRREKQKASGKLIDEPSGSSAYPV